MSRGYYDTAQICLNGHLINERVNTFPPHNQEYCSLCGAKTITKCLHCQADIRGAYDVPGVAVFGLRIAVPRFCHACGHAYPWTEARLQAAEDLADELDKLNDEEKTYLKDSVNDIVRDTPQTPVAATRFKRLVAKAGSEAASMFRDLLVDIASETAKKIIWPGP